MYKYYDITDENVEFLKMLKKQENLKSEKAAINYVIENFRKYYENGTEEERIAEAVFNKINEGYGRGLSNLLKSSNLTEETTQIILDIANTLLFSQGIENCILTDKMASPVVELSRTYYKHKISDAKQKKDNRH